MVSQLVLNHPAYEKNGEMVRNVKAGEGVGWLFFLYLMFAVFAPSIKISTVINYSLLLIHHSFFKLLNCNMVAHGVININFCF